MSRDSDVPAFAPEAVAIERTRYEDAKEAIQSNTLRLEKELIALRDILQPFIGPRMSEDSTPHTVMPEVSDEVALMVSHAEQLENIADHIADLRRRVFN